MPLFGRRGETFDAPLPAWARRFQQRLRQRGGNTFILHGPGVRDLHPLGMRRWGALRSTATSRICSVRS